MIFAGLRPRQFCHGGDGGVDLFLCVEHREAEPHRALLYRPQRFMHPWRAVCAGAGGDAVAVQRTGLQPGGVGLRLMTVKRVDTAAAPQ